MCDLSLYCFFIVSSLVWKPQCKQSAGLDAVQVYCLENVRDFLSVKGAVLKKVDGLCLNW